jgi:hypothetical protein
MLAAICLIRLRACVRGFFARVLRVSPKKLCGLGSGDHRLLCGDSLKTASYMALLEGQSAWFRNCRNRSSYQRIFVFWPYAISGVARNWRLSLAQKSRFPATETV